MAGTQNAVGHTVASLISRRRGYATLLLLKVLLTRPLRSPLHTGLRSHLFLLAETVRAGEKNLHEPDACVSAEGE